MAKLIKADGTEREIHPRHRKFVFPGELYPLLATDVIEEISIGSGQIMLVDEHAKLRWPRKPLNQKATKLLLEWCGGPKVDICGDVVVCTSKEI